MTLRIVAVNLEIEAISAAWLDLLDHYACDPMGGGEGLSAYARMHLVDELKRLPTFHGALAWRGEKPLGLINCFTGFSTFAARPLLNIHDIVVHADARRQGIGQALAAVGGTAGARARLLQADAGNSLRQYAGDGVLRARGLCSLCARPCRRACPADAKTSPGAVMQEPVPAADPQVVRPSLVQLTHIIYGLHAIAVLVGVTSAATVAGGFVFGLPSLIAVFLNYLKRSDVNGTWLESHFRWQIRTFWFTLLWLVVYGLLIITIIGIPIAWILIAHPRPVGRLPRHSRLGRTGRRAPGRLSQGFLSRGCSSLPTQRANSLRVQLPVRFRLLPSTTL